MLQATKDIGKWIPKDVAYYLNLDKSGVITSLRYRFKKSPIIYGIRCRPDGMIYVGSSLAPGLRFHKHLITGEESNQNLQDAISEHSLGQFTVHIFKVVDFPAHFNYCSPLWGEKEKKTHLLKLEQEYLDMIPHKRLYNTSKAVK